jgi:hypothetical protein
MKLQGVVRKWVDNSWGIAHSYSRSTDAPEKFFVHKTKLTDASATLDAGVRISFEIGPVRRKGDLPPAIDIEIVPMRPTTAQVKSSAGGAR